MLVNLAAHDISHTTSQAYSELLKLVERKIPRCRTDLGVEFPEEAEDEEDDSTEADPQHIVGTTDVLKVLPSHVKLSTGLVIQDDDDDDGDEAVTSPQRKRKRKPNDVGGPNGRDDHDDSDVDEHGNIREVERDSDDEIWDRDFDPGASKKSPQKQRKVAFVDDHASREDFHNRLIELKRHLGVLAVHSRKFVTQEGGHGSGDWSVPFRKLIKSLKEAELDKIIYQMFGRLGLRISQILRQKGKLEERGIQGMGLMKIKDVKSKLIEMQLAGFVDVQEIPKGNNRAFQQMIYLWYFDTPRVEQLVLDKIYKAMTRSLQALQAEKGNYLEVLAMAERTDVRGNEEELLSEVALRDLRKIRAFEEKTYVQINRLDELVGVFRDF
jgi:DNA-directed RNA polymerase III subunit RPC3